MLLETNKTMRGRASDIEQLQFLTPAETADVRAKFGSPAYVYDMGRLQEQADKALAFPNAYGEGGGAVQAPPRL